MKKIVVGSRESLLAVAQSMTVVRYLEENLPDAEISLLKMKTTGDKILDRTLDKVGGKGLFVKELDTALREERADLCVHSLKDVPMITPPDLPLIGYSKREDPRDVLVLPKGRDCPDPELPIGTASLRRAMQIKPLFPGYNIRPVRGNLQTRLRKLDEGEYGALILAAAGLKRMGLEDRISRYFSTEQVIPAAGQGILALQGRSGEDYSYLEKFCDPGAAACAVCERAFTTELGGGCSSPICAFAQVEGDRIRLRALYYGEKSGVIRTGQAEDDISRAAALGRKLAEKLRAEDQ
uniref:hydroxymethylbilane synthase n=1 Tax=Eubacterium cellulosolvens TaxID=29322 RepID=UPI0004869830|nr:hydroxymethylbilane synthase [[Eubacterium] cellulosolvens]